MKISLFCLIIFTAFLNFSCQRNVESSAIAVKERIEITPEPVPTPDEYEVIDVIEKISTRASDKTPTSIEFEDYKIRKVSVKKREDSESPVTAIFDAVLSKNGKTIARFEGVYHPVGNSMDFGFFPFLGGTERQLLVVDENPRYDREWIVSLTPKYEILFDAADYAVEGGGMRLTDIDKDGVYELFYGSSVNLGFMPVAMSEMPIAMVIFKFDSKTRKYLPATHIFTDFTLRGIDKKVLEFDRSKNNSILGLLDIFMAYVYAGKEDEAWKFFDKEGMDFSAYDTLTGKVEGKEQIKRYVRRELNKDPIYKFIRRDLRRAK